MTGDFFSRGLLRLAGIFLAAALMAGCGVDAPALPSPTDVPTATSTAVPTEAPEPISDAKELPAWVEEFTHAYGGMVKVDGSSLSAQQLTNLIRSDPEAFLERKSINGNDYQFLMVNGIPLAFRQGDGSWREATPAELSGLADITLEFSRLGLPDEHEHAADYLRVLGKVAGKGSQFTFPNEMDTCRIFNEFLSEDWNRVISEWPAIQADLGQGKVPAGFPYRWQPAQRLIDFARSHVEEPRFRGQHLVELNLPGYCMLAESIVNFQQQAGREDMLKLLEFAVRTRVIRFPEVMSWDAEDEMIAANLEADTGGDASKRFWNNATGLSPADLTSRVAGWIRQDNPQARIYVVEDVIFEDGYAPLQVAAFDKFLVALHEMNAPVDGVISENNFWVLDPPSMEFISAKIDEYGLLGFEIGGSETMIISGDVMINDPNRKRTVEAPDPNLAQAELYRDLLALYLDKGITTIGFGGIDDYNAWTNDVGLPEANPLLFDDEFRTKPSYYAVAQALYEHLP